MRTVHRNLLKPCPLMDPEEPESERQVKLDKKQHAKPDGVKSLIIEENSDDEETGLLPRQIEARERPVPAPRKRPVPAQRPDIGNDDERRKIPKTSTPSRQVGLESVDKHTGEQQKDKLTGGKR